MVAAALAFMSMICLLPDADEAEWKSPPVTWSVGICYSIIVTCSATTEIFMQVGTVALEADWPGVLIPKDKDQGGKWMAELQSYMSSIDQMSKLLGPTVYGILVQFFSGGGPKETVLSGVAIVLACNLICVPLEWFTLASLFSSHPDLGNKSSKKKAKTESFIGDFVNGWKTFVSHPLFMPSWSSVLVSFTVLNQSPVSTAWLLWAHVPLGSLGFLRGLGAVSGIVGSWSYPWIHGLLGGSAVQTANAGIWAFAISLLPCAASMFVWGATPTGAWALLWSMTLSRFALFWFKPAVNQLTQELVDADVRGAFTGVRKSLNKVFCVGIAAAAMVFSKPSQFPILVYLSVAAVTSAAVVFTAWTLRDKQGRVADQS